jgi:hypothetical protein
VSIQALILVDQPFFNEPGLVTLALLIFFVQLHFKCVQECVQVSTRMTDSHTAHVEWFQGVSDSCSVAQVALWRRYVSIRMCNGDLHLSSSGTSSIVDAWRSCVLAKLLVSAAMLSACNTKI